MVNPSPSLFRIKAVYANRFAKTAREFNLIKRLLLMVGFVSSCLLSLSAIIVHQDWELSNFSTISINDSFQFSISQGPTFKVSTTVDQRYAKEMSVTQNGAALTIGFPAGLLKAGFVELHVEITLPSLVKLQINGACHGKLNGFAENKLDLAVNGASSLDMQSCSADSLNISALGASSVRVDSCHATTAMNIQAKGASTVNLQASSAPRGELKITGASTLFGSAKTSCYQILDVTVTGASKLTIDVTEAVSGVVQGASMAGFGGNGKVSVSLDGASNLSQR